MHVEKIIRALRRIAAPSDNGFVLSAALLALLLGGVIAGCGSSAKATDDDDEYVEVEYEGDPIVIERMPEEERDDDLFDPLSSSATEIPEDIEEFEVDGLTVIHRPTGSSFHTVFAKLYIRGGLPAIPAGVSPAIEQLALDVPRFSGPASMGRAAYLRERDRLYIGLGATAERDFSTLSLKSTDENFDRGWEIFTGLVLDPGFDATAMTNITERAVIGVRNRRVVPEAYADYLADSVFFYGHPYGRVAEEADYATITERDLRDYHKTLFVKSRLFLVVVGNVTKQEITEKVRATLGKLPEGSYKEPKIAVPVNAGKSALIVRSPWGREDIPTNYLVVRHLAPGYGEPLFYAMHRLNSFIGGFLFRKIRIDRNLSYAPGADVYDHRLGFGDISISTVLPDSAWRVTRDEIIDFFRENIIDEKYLKDVPATWFTSEYMNKQTAEAQANEIGNAWFYTGDWREAFRTLEHEANVSPDEMNEAAFRYLDDFTFIIVGDPKAVDYLEYMDEVELNEVEEPSGSEEDD